MEMPCAGRGLGYGSFASSWCVFSAKCGSSISARFLIYGAHAACFLPLVGILDPLCNFKKDASICRFNADVTFKERFKRSLKSVMTIEREGSR
jgi:hypothetical protein